MSVSALNWLKASSIFLSPHASITIYQSSRDARRLPSLRPAGKKKSRGSRGFSGFQSVQSAQSVACPSSDDRIVFGNGGTETAIAEGNPPTNRIQILGYGPFRAV